MNLVLIRRSYNDGEFPNSGIIGAIRTELDSSDVETLWDVWRKEVPFPDADSLFIDWLIEKGYHIEDVSFMIADV